MDIFTKSQGVIRNVQAHNQFVETQILYKGTTEL